MNPLAQKAFAWVRRESGEDFLTSAEHCPSRDILQARLEHLAMSLAKNNFEQASLLVAVLGEIGNNVFDHNLGKWRDVAGAYFAYDLLEKVFIVADRGQGIKQTISRVKPGIANDIEALEVAFTETLSGRQPEQRGNGLKFVKATVSRLSWSLRAYSGKATLNLSGKDKIEVKDHATEIQGTIMIIQL